jgi:hypothetical protein
LLVVTDIKVLNSLETITAIGIESNKATSSDSTVGPVEIQKTRKKVKRCKRERRKKYWRTRILLRNIAWGKSETTKRPNI